MSNLDIVKGIYEAFGRGDIPAILGVLREDVEFEHDAVDRGIPWAKPGRGIEHAKSFFGVVATQLVPRKFEVHQLLAGGDQVAVIAEVGWLVVKTGRELRDYETHLWTLDREGRVARLRHFIDTAAHLAALQP